MIRLFVALALPQSLRERLAMLAGGVPGARWTDPENMHLTLRFIGEVAEDRIADIHLALSRVRQPAFSVTIAGVGFFKQGRNPTLLWAGVERNDALLQLQQQVDHALQREDLGSESRRYTPHVTLARLQRSPESRVAEFVAHHNLFRAPPFVADSFTLFSSFLSSSGAIYTPEADYPLLTIA